MNSLIATIYLALAAAASLEPTSSFRGDERHSGIYAGPAVPAVHELKWKFKTNGPVLSSPTVTQNTVYIGSNDHYLYALSVADGTELWKYKTDSRVASSPAVYAGRVYFGSYDGNIYALDAQTGKLRWKFASKGEQRFTESLPGLVFRHHDGEAELLERLAHGAGIVDRFLQLRHVLVIVVADDQRHALGRLSRGNDKGGKRKAQRRHRQSQPYQLPHRGPAPAENALVS